jgi:hypothetical protein
MVSFADSIYIVGSEPTAWAEYARVAWGNGIPPEFRTEDAPQVEPLSQRDPRWRSTILGFSSYSIGSQGCALTCAAMIARLVNPDLTPPALQDLLKPAGGFWQANLNWAAVPRVVSGLTFEGITNWESGAANVGEIITQLEEHPLILWIDYAPGGGQQSHFVLGLEYLPDFEDIVIADPWDGYTGRLLFRYGLTGWTLARAIYGMRPLYPVATTHAAAASYVAQVTRDAFDDFPEPRRGKQARVAE